MTKSIRKPTNADCTRVFSDRQEKAVASLTGGTQTVNSGATRFTKGDVVCRDIGLMIECKTCTKDRDSFSIRKEWVEKDSAEGFGSRLPHQAIAFNFGPGSRENLFVIDESLMSVLLDALRRDASEENS